MRFYSRFFFNFLLSALLCLIAVPSLASNVDSGASSKALEQRAKEYWEHKVKGEFDKSFPYEDPATVKDLTLAEYARSTGGGVKWLSAEPEKVVIDENKGGVYIKIRYLWTFVDPAQQAEKGFEQAFWDHWTLVDGTWYHQFKSFKNLSEQLGAKPSGTAGQEAKPADSKMGGDEAPPKPKQTQ